MLKHSTWLFIFCLAGKDLDLLLFFTANIDGHIIIHAHGQSPEKVMIFSFILIFSHSSLPLLELYSLLPPHWKEKKPVKSQGYEVLCSPLLSFIIDFYIGHNKTPFSSGNCLSLSKEHISIENE